MSSCCTDQLWSSDQCLDSGMRQRRPGWSRLNRRQSVLMLPFSESATAVAYRRAVLECCLGQSGQYWSSQWHKLPVNKWMNYSHTVPTPHLFPSIADQVIKPVAPENLLWKVGGTRLVRIIKFLHFILWLTCVVFPVGSIIPSNTTIISKLEFWISWGDILHSGLSSSILTQTIFRILGIMSSILTGELQR